MLGDDTAKTKKPLQIRQYTNARTTMITEGSKTYTTAINNILASNERELRKTVEEINTQQKTEHQTRREQWGHD